MRLGSLNNGSRDGEMILISGDMTTWMSAASVASSLREALENWDTVQKPLLKLSEALNAKSGQANLLDFAKLKSCLPRTFLFADGSAFIHHIKLVRKARNAALPETLSTVPLMYQAEGGSFLDPLENIPQLDFAHGTDFEAEVGVITDDVPMGVTPQQALDHIKLVTLINDVSLRGLIPAELAQGFGFFQSKPQKALAPIALTPDELGDAWKSGRVHLPLRIDLNGQQFGRPNVGEMHFHFGDLIAHAAKTRNLVAGTLIGSGTVSNENAALGSGCLAEKRTLEQIQRGQPETPFLKDGDQVKIWMEDGAGRNLFGAIQQRVQKIAK